VICVSLTTATPVAADPPRVTAVAPVNPLPLMMTAAPDAPGPIEATIGAGALGAVDDFPSSPHRHIYTPHRCDPF